MIGSLLFHSYYFAAELDMSMPEIEEYGSALGLTRIWPTAETPPHCPVRFYSMLMRRTWLIP